MRRTTICRSKQAARGVAVALLCLSPVARAQEGAAGAPEQVPASHTVSQGETLWAISQMYYGDPLLWPEVYRLNTAVVEDPHWIYPGEVLVLAPAAVLAQGMAPTDTISEVVQRAPADTVELNADTMMMDTAFAAPPPLDVPASAETMFDTRPTTQQRVQGSLRAYAELPNRPVRRGEFYAAGFLTENEDIPWAIPIQGTDAPSIATLEYSGQTQWFGEIAIRPAPGASYHVGDSLLVATLDRRLVDWGDVVVPVGIVQVTLVQPQQILGTLVAQYSAPRRDRRYVAMPLEPFRDPGEVRPVPVETGLEGTMIGLRDIQWLAGTQDYVFIDRGRSDGVVPGDLFEAYRTPSPEPGSASPQVLATLQVVHTREHSATALIVGLTRADLRPGTPVRLTHKMPS